MGEDTRDERAETDARLRAERAKTDAELDRRRAKVEEHADVVVDVARARADAVLTTARQRADHMGQSSTTGEASNRVADERERADVMLATERNVEDTVLDAERVARQVALASLLATERQETDSHLLLERLRVDETLSKREDFLAMVSHDLRSLLGAIAMNVAMIDTQSQVGPGQVTRYTGSIKRATAQMTRLLSDLLEVASFDAGKVVLLPRRHDASALVHQLVEAFAPTASSKGLTLSARTPTRRLLGEFDPDRLGQVLTNLIGNALKFTPAGGRVSAGVELQGSDLCFSVVDNGQGIPPEKLETVFERYSQVSPSDQRGLGLGLYIARRIVEAHGGRIEVRSTCGQGSTFIFSVPASAAAARR